MISWRVKPVRPTSAAYYLFLAAALIAAAIARFRLPQEPFIDADYWGYLNPALSKLTGGVFQHTFGRDSLYPGFVYVLLRMFGDFRAISVVQHVFGLATGVLLAVSFERFCLLLGGRAPGALRLAGLAPAAAYLTSPYALMYEHSVRPEAIFPFFAILSILLDLEFVRRRWVEPRPRLAAWLGAAGFVVSIVLYKLKPSFGFAAIFVNVPLAVSLVQRGMSWRLKAGMAGGAAAFAAVLLVLPERVLARNDPIGFMFLADTLFTIHADMIRDQMAEDLASGRPLAYPREMVSALHARLETTIKASTAHAYRSLGFDPDYLLYTDSVFERIFPNTPAGYHARAEVGAYYYRRTALHHPWRMLRKILRQLEDFYHFERSGTFLRSKHTIAPEKPLLAAPLYQRNVDVYDSRGDELNRYAPARAFYAASEKLEETPAAMAQPAVLSLVQALLSFLYMPGLLAALATCAWALSSAVRRTRWGLPALLVPLIYSYNFGNNLTIAVVHSLDIGRYILNELAFTLLASTVGLVFVGGVWSRTLLRLSGPAVAGWQPAAAIPLLPRIPRGQPPPSISVLVLGADEPGEGRAAEYRGALPGARVFAAGSAAPWLDLLDAFSGLEDDVLLVAGRGADCPGPAPALLASYLEEPADMILASGASAPTAEAQLLARFFGCRLADPSSELRLLSRRFCRHVPLMPRGLDWPMELTLQALGNGFAVREISGGAGSSQARGAWRRDAPRVLRLLLAALRDCRPFLACCGVAGVCLVLAVAVGWEPLRVSYTKRHDSHAVSALIAASLLLLAILALPTGVLLDAALRRRRAAMQLRIRDDARCPGTA